MNFKDFNFKEPVFEAIDAMGFESATPVQELAIPEILKGNDLIACAQTGTGKTAAFLLPVLDKISADKSSGIKVLIIAPTRELTKQIDQQLEGFSYFLNTSTLSIYGGGDGMSWDQQKTALTKGADVIVATPGRLISHLSFDYVDMSQVKFLILDEADRMLDMGFYDDILNIISHLPEKRQTLLFSATMPDKIRVLTKKILSNPKQIDIAIAKPAEGIMQAAYMVHDFQKPDLITKLLKKKDLASIIVFTSTKVNVRNIYKVLKSRGFNTELMHSDLEQSQREEVMLNFKNRKVQILVATNIVSRGIDIDGIDLIINYDVPGDAEDYVHRVGRTARAKSSGVALTFINEDDISLFNSIEKMIGQEVYKSPLPEGFEKGPVYTINSDKRKSKRNYKSSGKKQNWRNKKGKK